DLKLLESKRDSFAVGAAGLGGVARPAVSVAEVAEELFVVRGHCDRFFVHLGGLVIVLEEKVSGTEVGVSWRVRSERESFLKLRNGFAPLPLPQIDGADPFIAHGVVAGDFDQLLILRQ